MKARGQLQQLQHEILSRTGSGGTLMKGLRHMPERPRKRPSPALRSRSAELRREQTPAEQIMWQHLRGGKTGAKFRRQHVIGRFIADFCSLEQRLIIEIDGPVHQQQGERDAERTLILEGMGYRVLRYTNEQVLYETAEVLARIRAALADTSVPPLPHAGEGDRG